MGFLISLIQTSNVYSFVLKSDYTLFLTVVWVGGGKGGVVENR